MRFVFDDGKIREVPYDPVTAARLIHQHQETGKADFKIQINPDLPKKEQEKRLREIQHYYDWYEQKSKKIRGKC